jgi:hypothetical protein
MFLSNLSAFAQELAPPPKVNLPIAPTIKPAVIWDCGCGMEAHYAGGSRGLSEFVNAHIDLPSDIYWGNTTRTHVFVGFYIEKDGSLSDLRIIRTIFPELNSSILAVFRKTTNWVAGEYRCEATRTWVRVPISIIIR